MICYLVAGKRMFIFTSDKIKSFAAVAVSDPPQGKLYQFFMEE
jgi:hypothetical protein